MYLVVGTLADTKCSVLESVEVDGQWLSRTKANEIGISPDIAFF